MTYIGHGNAPDDNYDTVHKFGFLSDMDLIDVDFDVWDGNSQYGGWLAANTAMTISSDDPADTSDGEGARTVTVEGIVESGNDWVATSELVTMNGVEGVTLANSYRRVYRAYVSSVGGNAEGNEGHIYIGFGTITAGKPANVVAQITSNFGQSLMAIYTVPSVNESGERYAYGEITGWYTTIAAPQAAFCVALLQTNQNGQGWRARGVRLSTEGAYSERLFPFGLRLTPKTDIRIRISEVGSNNNRITGGFDIRMRTR
jgi:hypothetical protein